MFRSSTIPEDEWQAVSRSSSWKAFGGRRKLGRQVAERAGVHSPGLLGPAPDASSLGRGSADRAALRTRDVGFEVGPTLSLCTALRAGRDARIAAFATPERRIDIAGKYRFDRFLFESRHGSGGRNRPCAR